MYSEVKQCVLRSGKGCGAYFALFSLVCEIIHELEKEGHITWEEWVRLLLYNRATLHVSPCRIQCTHTYLLMHRL